MTALTPFRLSLIARDADEALKCTSCNFIVHYVVAGNEGRRIKAHEVSDNEGICPHSGYCCHACTLLAFGTPYWYA
ncbi:hypothetical protein V6N13_140939 [Hibiscus sabdariffa]